MKYVLPITFLLLASCGKKTETTESIIKPEKVLMLHHAEWLLGNWGSTSPEGKWVENWQKVNDTVFNGESYFIVNDKDTVFGETVVLRQVNNRVSYTVSVPKQNDEKPVRFDMTGMTAKEMVFENPAHDYPTKIVYTEPVKDSLVATIYGKKNGKDKSETFKMKRIK